MRIFSYRNKRRAKIALLISGALAGVVLLFVVCRVIYLQRFLVYEDNGVSLDFQQLLDPEGVRESETIPSFALDIEPAEQVRPVFSAGSAPTEALSGYYVTTSMLLDMEKVESALEAMETPPQTLLFEMKSIYGNFYYDSDISGSYKSSADIAAIEDMIARYGQNDEVYLAARIPAFTDNNFALDNQSSGLPLRSGALWMDDNNCYWLDPMSEDVQLFLVTMAEELAERGFDEIVFDGFMIPDSKNIVYDSGEWTREEAAAEAARMLREALADLSIRISFGSESALVAEHTDRLYLTTDNGAAVDDMVAAVLPALEVPETQIVFQTASRDTRFEGYGILRPLVETVGP